MTPLIMSCLWFSLFGQVPAAYRAVDFAPDGEHAVVMTGSDLKIVSLSANPPHSVPDSTGGYAPRYSPDGKYIVFGSIGTAGAVVKLYAVAQDVTKKVIDNGDPPFEWRSDSDSFVATRVGDDGKLNLLRYHPSTNDLYKVEPLPVTHIREGRFVWLSNTDDVAFIGDDDNVYLDEAGQTVRLTSTGDVTGLVISDDGKRLIWTVRNPDARAQLLTLYSMVIDSRTVSKLSFPAQPLGRLQRQVKQVDEVVFSPDHKHFAMLVSFNATAAPAKSSATSERSGSPATLQAIYTCRLDGSEFRKILQDRSTGDTKRRPMIWSRGGELLAISVDEGAKLAVYDIKHHTAPRMISLQ